MTSFCASSPRQLAGGFDAARPFFSFDSQLFQNSVESFTQTDERHSFGPSCLTTGAPIDEHRQPEDQSISATGV